MTRLARIFGGFGLIVVGAFLLFLPGPGILTIMAGLAILAREFQWADDALSNAKRRTARLRGPEDRRPDDKDLTDQEIG